MLTQPPTAAWISLCGVINQAMFRSLLSATLSAASQGVEHLHLLIQSEGGILSDGLAMANVLRGMPLKVTAYNVGHVGSAAVFPYLAAHRRIAAPTATFLFHRPYSPALQGATAAVLAEAAAARSLDDERVEAFFGDAQTALKLTADFRTRYERGDVLIGPTEAIQLGIVNAIGLFSPAERALTQNLIPA